MDSGSANPTERFDPLMPVSQVAEVLGRRPRQVRALIRSGKLRGFKDQGRWYSTAGNVEAYLGRLKPPKGAQP